MAVPIWTPPSTFVVGHIETADELNVALRDNMNFLNAAKAASVYRGTSAQSIADNGPNTTVLFNAETYDPWDLHSTVTNTGRLTIPAALAGVWKFTASVQFAANATGYRYLIIDKNGGTTLSWRWRDALASGVTSISTTVMATMAAGDYVQATVFQNSGGALNLDFGSALTYFQAHFLGTIAS